MVNTTEKNNFILYTTDEGHSNIQIIADSENETIWLNQKQLADIFDTSKQNISSHISNIIQDGELDNSVVKNFLTTASDGKNYNTDHYNLDMIIAVGYRVNSYKATQFRIWATKTLKEFIIKGFVLDDERLKQGNQVFNKDYFDELLDRIRDIRASEKLFYEKVKDIFTLSVDYDVKSEDAHYFFANIQNKIEYAIVGMTSAEIIQARANHSLPNMGLMTFEGKKIRAKDVKVAKNYLAEDEIKNLNRLVTMLLDYLENQTRMGKLFHMKDWNEKLDNFLKFNEYEILKGYGKVKADTAKKFAAKELKQYKARQDELETQEFDKVIEEIKATGKIPSTVSKKKVKELSKFDKSLKKALDHNPKND